MKLVRCYNFYTGAKTLQIQGKENAEQLKLNLIDLAKEKLPEEPPDEVTWPGSEKQSDEKVIELEPVVVKDSESFCNQL